MTSYPLLTETSLTTDWATHYHADYLGYELLGWVISPNSILPTPSLDHSTRLGGQTHLLLSFGGSLALMQAALWQPIHLRVCGSGQVLLNSQSFGECFSEVWCESWVPVADDFPGESIPWVDVVEIQLGNPCPWDMHGAWQKKGCSRASMVNNCQYSI